MIQIGTSDMHFVKSASIIIAIKEPVVDYICDRQENVIHMSEKMIQYRHFYQKIF